MARRKWRSGSAWSRGNIKQMWMPAEILKVRSASSEEKETYDVRHQCVVLCCVVVILIDFVVMFRLICFIDLCHVM